MKKTTKRLISMMLCLTAATSSAMTFASCGGDEDGTITKIVVRNFNGGVGSEWLNEAVARFEAARAEESYAEGKTGVKVQVVAEMGHVTGTMATSGENIIIDEWNADIQALSASGLLLNINDIVEPLEDKIFDVAKSTLKGNDGNYYGLPHYEFYHGLSYNIDVFDRYDFYFAAPDETDTYSYTAYGKTVKFTKNDTNETGTNAKKACGVDGIYGTYDDGLPTSLQDMMILCSYMKQRSVSPLMLGGSVTNYIAYMLTGLWTSLSGKAQMDTTYSFNGPSEVVTGFSNEPLITGMNGIYKPTTEKITMTNATGYLTYSTASRYYSLAFLEHALDSNWFSAEGLGGTVSHTDAQSAFVLSGVNGQEEIGMLVEGSYWYNEATESGVFEDYELFEEKEARIGWMPLPSSLDTTVTEGNGAPSSLLESANAHLLINNNIKDNPELVKACKDFVSFLYSDAELKAFTASTGCARPMQYSMEEADFNGNTFASTLWKIRDGGKNVTYFGGDNPIFQTNKAKFLIYLHTPLYKPTNPEGVSYGSCYKAMVDGGMTAREIFENTKDQLTKASWEQSYSKYFNED